MDEASISPCEHLIKTLRFPSIYSRKIPGGFSPISLLYDNPDLAKVSSKTVVN